MSESNANDAGAGSLRQAITDAASGDTINAGSNVTCPAIDQRGVARARTIVDACDSGAYEAPYTAPPTVAKAFGVAALPLNGSTTLTFNVANRNAGTALSGIGFTDTLPAGLVVATPNGASGSCGGGAIAALAGSDTIDLSGATLAAASHCVFAVNVTGTAAGAKDNTTGAIASTNGGVGATSNTTTVTVAMPVATLDADASNAATKYDALTDGLLITRYLLGLTGTSLTTDALGGTATITDAAAIKAYLDGISTALDIDGNGTADAATDGLLILRYMFGLRGSALIDGAADPLGARPTAAAIETYIQSLMP